MRKILLETSFSKIYMIVMIIITLLILGSYFSYAMFTVTKEKSNAISIVTGNLTYKLLVDGSSDGNTLTVEPNSSKEFIVTLSNPNNRVARFNFYYIGDTPSNVSVGYINEEGYSITPDKEGINLEKNGTSGSNNTYKIRVSNYTDSSFSLTLGVEVGLDYNDLSLPNNGRLFNEYEVVNVSEVLLSTIPNTSQYNDGVDTFITGENPNNYIWYSGKLWRAVSVNNEAKTTKLVTQWNISAIPYDDNSSNFEGSHMEMWLNDTSVDGFLGNLRDYENFIVTDAKWDATMDNKTIGSITRPSGTTTVVASVGLLNTYEYQSSYHGTTYRNGYLNNGLIWWTLTSYNSIRGRYTNYGGYNMGGGIIEPYGVRPSINLQSNVKIVDGDGTESNPYRLEGDNDTDLSGTLLNTRYSGEYITFGTGENTLYRIVSHETSGLTKITSAEPLKSGRNFITSAFGSNTTFSSSNTIGKFLNNDYLNNETYLTSEQKSMIEGITTWYLGAVADGQNYRLAKYKDYTMSELTSKKTTVKVGLLRLGELMSGQFCVNENNTPYWTLTPRDTSYIRNVSETGYAGNLNYLSNNYGVRPALNLKSNVVITGGTGLKNDPFTLELQ